MEKNAENYNLWNVVKYYGNICVVVGIDFCNLTLHAAQNETYVVEWRWVNREVNDVELTDSLLKFLFGEKVYPSKFFKMMYPEAIEKNGYYIMDNPKHENFNEFLLKKNCVGEYVIETDNHRIFINSVMDLQNVYNIYREHDNNGRLEDITEKLIDYYKIKFTEE